MKTRFYLFHIQLKVDGLGGIRTRSLIAYHQLRFRFADKLAYFRRQGAERVESPPDVLPQRVRYPVTGLTELILQ